MMKLVKKNKFTIIVVVLFVIFMFGVSEIKKMFFASEGAVYGDRLVGKVEVDKETYDQLKEHISQKEKVESVEIRENGRSINISITVANDTSLEQAKAVTDGAIDLFTDSQKGYYDFQAFIYKTDAAENNFPIIGYRHHNSSVFVWSKDRDKTDISS
ncbi:MAG: hypothetical protein K2I72_02965 [Bacilli bacterium]|nr:hypothetical protein [Bacilli bacterium]